LKTKRAIGLAAMVGAGVLATVGAVSAGSGGSSAPASVRMKLDLRGHAAGLVRRFTVPVPRAGAFAIEAIGFTLKVRQGKPVTPRFALGVLGGRKLGTGVAAVLVGRHSRPARSERFVLVLDVFHGRTTARRAARAAEGPIVKLEVQLAPGEPLTKLHISPIVVFPDSVALPPARVKSLEEIVFQPEASPAYFGPRYLDNFGFRISGKHHLNAPFEWEVFSENVADGNLLLRNYPTYRVSYLYGRIEHELDNLSGDHFHWAGSLDRPPSRPPTVTISEDDTWTHNPPIGKSNICINVRTTPPQASISANLDGPSGYHSHLGKTPLDKPGSIQIKSEITKKGDYTKTLTVYDASGKQTATVTKTFTVASPPQDGPAATPPCPKPTQ
jgi:hypothetical protein